MEKLGIIHLYLIPLIPTVVTIALAVVAWLVTWGKVKETVNTNKVNINKIETAVPGMINELKMLLFRSDGMAIYMPRQEFMAHCEDCRNYTCKKLDKIDNSLLELGKERGEDMRHALQIVKEQSEFFGSVREFMNNVKIFMEEHERKFKP